MVPRSAERPKTIVLAGDLDTYHREGRAGETGILPGMLLDVNGETDEVEVSEFCHPVLIKHATGGQDCPVRVAKEAPYSGKTHDSDKGRTVDDAYEYDTSEDPDIKDVVFYHEAQRGDRLAVRVAAGTNWTRGTKLGSAGNGLFAASGTKRLVEVAENLDDSAGSGDPILLVVSVL